MTLGFNLRSEYGRAYIFTFVPLKRHMFHFKRNQEEVFLFLFVTIKKRQHDTVRQSICNALYCQLS